MKRSFEPPRSAAHAGSTTRSSTMDCCWPCPRKDIYWVCVFKLKPSEFAAFKQVVSPLVAATKQEPGALAYEYNVSDDQSTIHIIEHYRDSNAVVAHVQQTFAKFADAFTKLATVSSFVVYGTPNSEARKILDSFGAVYLKPFDGFTR